MILLSCVVVLLAMTGVYFGSNVMSIANEYRQRIAHLETRVDELENSELVMMVVHHYGGNPLIMPRLVYV